MDDNAGSAGGFQGEGKPRPYNTSIGWATPTHIRYRPILYYCGLALYYIIV